MPVLIHSIARKIQPHRQGPNSDLDNHERKAMPENLIRIDGPIGNETGRFIEAYQVATIGSRSIEAAYGFDSFRGRERLRVDGYFRCPASVPRPQDLPH